MVVAVKALHPLDIVLGDEDAERTRRNHDQRIRQLASRPAFALTVLGEFALADGVATSISHKLGRIPAQVILSPPRGAVSAGYTEELHEGDRTKSIKLKANGWGATVYVTVSVL